MHTSQQLDDVLRWLFADDPLPAGAVQSRARLLFLDCLGCHLARALRKALSAAAGFTAPKDATDSYLALALGREAARCRLRTAGAWTMLDGYLRPYAAVRHVHYGAAAAIQWRGRHGNATRDITAISVLWRTA